MKEAKGRLAVTVAENQVRSHGVAREGLINRVRYPGFCLRISLSLQVSHPRAVVLEIPKMMNRVEDLVLLIICLGCISNILVQARVSRIS